MELPKRYIATDIETRWYQFYLDNNLFDSKVDPTKKSYSIVIPPPNVTGALHMGHMLNNTLQDILIRRARMLGYNACWVPGTDHASIATEAKVVAWLKEKGITKNQLTRDEFVEYAWQWTKKYGGQILEQLKRIGCSCDWKRTKFTLDPSMSRSVIKVFIDLYEKGYIYKGYRMVNWDPKAQTTLSDEEVNYEDRKGKLYYINYQIEDNDNFLTVATTRPETILGDTAICINPNDSRYKHLQGKSAIVPIAQRKIPIITDDYVDIEFGTGCLKVTPAHDPNDKELGEKHNLPFIDIFHPNGSLNHHGLHYEGKDRFVVRQQIVEELKSKGYINQIKSYRNKVGVSERTNVIVEPRISEQWFLKMEKLAKPALDAVLNQNIKLYPSKFLNTYKNWLEDIRDWNISRQLWWGHRIPVYYYGPKKDSYVVAESIEDAVKKVQILLNDPSVQESDLSQDPDVLDTWFSSWLWPISVFDGINHPENPEIQYYYPTVDLVTGPDILFFWVARMIIAGYEYRNKEPFKNVFLTGIVRDDQGRKMAKQLGNSPDPIELIEEFGADGVRVGLMISTSAGNDLLFDRKLCKQGKNFANKIWNAFRLINGWEANQEKPTESQKQALKWFDSLLNQTLLKINKDFERYRISDALMSIYKLIWNDYCSWFLEFLKPDNNSISYEVIDSTKDFFKSLLRILHPFMPFITEELNSKLNKTQDLLSNASWPEVKAIDYNLIKEFEFPVKRIVSDVRKNRRTNKVKYVSISPKETHPKSLTHFKVFIEKLARVPIIEKPSNPQNQQQYKSLTEEGFCYSLHMEDLDDASKNDSKKLSIDNEIERLQNFQNVITKKLSNPKFLQNAPQQVVDLERKKLEDTIQKIKLLEFDKAFL